MAPAQVEVMRGVGITADAAAISLAQEVAAELCGSGHVGDVAAQTMAEERANSGAVQLQEDQKRWSGYQQFPSLDQSEPV